MTTIEKHAMERTKKINELKNAVMDTIKYEGFFVIPENLNYNLEQAIEQLFSENLIDLDNEDSNVLRSR